MNYQVITIGSATQDVFIRSDEFRIIESDVYETGKAECLPLGSKIEIKDITFATGGGATNNAVSFARKGVHVACFAALGGDGVAQEVISDLEEEEVETSLFRKNTNKKTGYSVILVANVGGRTVLVHRGASNDLDAKSIPWDKLRTQWLHISSVAGNIDLLQEVAEFARRKRINIAINPGSREIMKGAQALQPILQQACVLFLNQEEAAHLTGESFDDLSGIIQALHALAGDTIFVITRGPDGVAVGFQNQLFTAGVIPEEETVDRTGAGDAFGSGFVSALVGKNNWQDQDIREAIRRGSANATSVLEYMGAKEGLLTKRQLSNKRWQELDIQQKSL